MATIVPYHLPPSQVPHTSLMANLFTQRVIELISRIPEGKVATYGSIASYAGDRSGARQVARILHSSSEKHDLPWHRVINRVGKIALPEGQGKLQRLLLEEEGIIFKNGRVDLEKYLWQPENPPDTAPEADSIAHSILWPKEEDF